MGKAGKFDPLYRKHRAGDLMNVCGHCGGTRHQRDNGRWVCPACEKVRHRSNPEQQRVYSRRYVAKNREKESERRRRLHQLAGYTYKSPSLRDKARKFLRNEVQAGRVFRPKNCSRCGAEGLIHGHHSDYTKPLDVRWLCSICHGLEHRKYVSEAERLLAEGGEPMRAKRITGLTVGDDAPLAVTYRVDAGVPSPPDDALDEMIRLTGEIKQLRAMREHAKTEAERVELSRRIHARISAVAYMSW